MNHFEIAVIGLAVMGRNLARNLASRKIRTLVFNRTTSKAKTLIKEHGSPYLDYRATLKALTQDLRHPRKLILMVKAGEAVDEFIHKLLPHLNRGDILIDAGNSYFKDTQRRYETLKKKGMEWVGLGVSGGEEGALKGPSLMPGGEAKAWQQIAPFLKKIAARDFKEEPCVTHIGPDGAGHYVKMIHNGIEYGVMQLLAEAYHLLKNFYRLPQAEIAHVFKKFNQGLLHSFLLEISISVLTRRDEFKPGYLIDFILDKAGQKGTGAWTAIDALQNGIPLPTITEAVYARTISALKSSRIALNRLYPKTHLKPAIPLKRFAALLEQALYASTLSIYAQGFEQIREAAKVNQWNINLAEVTRIWQGGCIIRADLLGFLYRAFRSAKGRSTHLFALLPVRRALQKNLLAWRQAVEQGARSGIPLPALSSSLYYFESMTTAELPANLLQGLRDYFGAHTYERRDRSGIFHTQWL